MTRSLTRAITPELRDVPLTWTSCEFNKPAKKKDADLADKFFEGCGGNPYSPMAKEHSLCTYDSNPLCCEARRRYEKCPKGFA